MQVFVLALLTLLPLTGVNGAHNALSGTGSTTRGWSCCKNSCSWSNKAAVNNPVIACDNKDNPLNNPARRDGCDSGGGSFACSDLSPWGASNDLAYGYVGVNLAASNESSWCCSCYQLNFTSGPVVGKSMIVQVVDTGSDLGDDQFDLLIPGGGQGATTGCSSEFNTSSIWGSQYGGVSHREDCDSFPSPLQGGCYWRFDWFRNADNPNVSWKKVSCPQSLTYISNCRRNDDPVSGASTPTPTSSAPKASGTVTQGGQCGGAHYNGPTVCVGGTVCTFVDSDHYYCLPDPASTRSTPTTTSQTPLPTIAQVWDQCGGIGWTGPTTCYQSQCVKYTDYWWQCQPYSSAIPAQPSATPPSNPQPPAQTNPWGWQFTRPHISWPGGPVPGTPVPSKAATPTVPAAGPSATLGQLYDQCGGATWKGLTQCAPGLKCVVMDEYYSQCARA